MIFARRRRPQVSAENQAMRTGEVSKILSKEWSAMPAVSSSPVIKGPNLLSTVQNEKQFYQDQARQLKEWFNSKYPDYVYRRRPNHSRRPRRKPDAAPDSRSIHDVADDGGFEDSADSPPDLEASHVPDAMADTLRAASSHEARQYNDKLHSRTANYSYPNYDPSYRSNGRHENHTSYPATNGDRFSGSPTSSSQMTPPLQYPGVSQSRTQSHSTSLYGNGSVDHQNWNVPSGRSSSWLGNSSERSYPSLAEPKAQDPTTNWQRPIPSSGNLAGSSAQSSYILPTLGSPFFPDHPPAQGALSNSHSQLTSYHSNDVSPPTLPLLSERQFDDPSNLANSSSIGTNTYHPTSGRNSVFYPSRATPQMLPSISSYAQTHPSPPGLSTVKGFW